MAGRPTDHPGISLLGCVTRPCQVSPATIGLPMSSCTASPLTQYIICSTKMPQLHQDISASWHVPAVSCNLCSVVRDDLLQKVRDVVAAHPKVMKYESRHAADGDYKADMMVSKQTAASETVGMWAP